MSQVADAEEAPPYCAIDATTGASVCGPSALALLSAMESAAFQAAANPYAATVVARFFDGAYRTGSSITIYNSGGCDTSSDLDWSVGVMPTGWNDRISSFQGYSNCDIKLWEHGWFSGATYGPASGASTLGYMDNRTSSFAGY